MSPRVWLSSSAARSRSRAPPCKTTSPPTACHALEGGLNLESIDDADLTSAYRLFLADSLNEGADEYDQDAVAAMGSLLR